MVTASPIDGFLLATAEALKALVERLTMEGLFAWATSLDNIVLNLLLFNIK